MTNPKRQEGKDEGFDFFFDQPTISPIFPSWTAYKNNRIREFEPGTGKDSQQKQHITQSASITIESIDVHSLARSHPV